MLVQRKNCNLYFVSRENGIKDKRVLSKYFVNKNEKVALFICIHLYTIVSER